MFISILTLCLIFLQSTRHDVLQTVVQLSIPYASCVVTSVSDSNDQIQTLYDITHKTVNLVIESYGELQICFHQRNNYVMTGLCLGKVAFHIETKGIALLKGTVQVVNQVSHCHPITNFCTELL